MDTKSPLTKRIEIHFDKMTERQVVEFLDLFPSYMRFIKELIYIEFRKYKRNPTQYKKTHGLM
jgi:hypothetical protein